MPDGTLCEGSLTSKAMSYRGRAISRAAPEETKGDGRANDCRPQSQDQTQVSEVATLRACEQTAADHKTSATLKAEVALARRARR
jgi:hypothetical protein